MRALVNRKRSLFSDVWPIKEEAGKVPDGWCGWPDHRQFALILTHDVETAKGQEKCHQLMELEKSLGFRSSFNFVPRRYNVSSDLRRNLASNGFEVGVHGLFHDGKLYNSRKVFRKRAMQINRYLAEWECVGFRSPSMHHNLDWIYDLDIEYDASTFDTDPFEPQPDGVETIFPFLVSGNSAKKGYVELPCTMPQDFTLFVLLKERSVDIWKLKLHWIVEKGGMALLNTHPDYMNFDRGTLKTDEYPARYYIEFLLHIRKNYNGQCWHALPKDISRFLLRLPAHSRHEKMAHVM